MIFEIFEMAEQKACFFSMSHWSFDFFRCWVFALFLALSRCLLRSMSLCSVARISLSSSSHRPINARSSSTQDSRSVLALPSLPQKSTRRFRSSLTRASSIVSSRCSLRRSPPKSIFAQPIHVTATACSKPRGRVLPPVCPLARLGRSRVPGHALETRHR